MHHSGNRAKRLGKLVRELRAMVLIATGGIVLSNSPVFTFAQEAKGGKAPAKVIAKNVGKDESASGKAQVPIQPSIIAGSAWAEITILASGGYFFPGSSQAEYLKPVWCAKLVVQKNNLAETLFGGGVDITYASPKDKEVPDGRMTYVTILPNATATFSVFDVVSAQVKAGPGLSAIYYQVKETSDFSLSLTLGASVGLFRIFGQHFVVGCEAAYWYYFQMHTSSATGIFGYMGYYF